MIKGMLLAAAAIVSGPLRLTPDNIPEIVSELTMEEKAALIVGGGCTAFDGVGYTELYVPGAAGTTHPVERLGIPAIVLADGPAGVRIKDRNCTKFPIGTALAATWNPEIVGDVGKAIGNEAGAYGIDVMLAPGVNIHRNPLCGRNFEYYSEDPVLAGVIAAGYINGIQSEGVGTSIKHFAANSQELNRLFLDARVSRRALREIYLRNFEIAIRLSNPWTVMTSYNYVNGVHASENHDLATGVLRDDWGYGGTVMTDWGAGLKHVEIVRSGNDMIQPGSDRIYQTVLDAMRSGELSMEDVDRNVTRILQLVVKCHRFSGITGNGTPDLVRNAETARKAAEEGMVMLKNSALPLKPGSDVALFGVASYKFITGGIGSGDVNGSYTVNVRDGLKDAGFVLDSGLDTFYRDYLEYEDYRCGRINGTKRPWIVDEERPCEVTPKKVELERLAEASDCAVITMGRVFGEAKDRLYQFSYLLSADEKRLIDEVSAAFRARGKKVVVILDVGGIIDMESWQDKADAVVVCWLPGCEGGHAVADVLSGKANPSGRLPMTIPADYHDDPTSSSMPQVLTDKRYNYSFYRRSESGKRYEIPNIDYLNYTEGIYVGYRHYLTEKVRTAYPFGFGLSYTSFTYGDMKVSEDGDAYEVSLNVRNTGDVPGKEVVQIYVKAPGKEMDKPERELKGFAKTGVLAPGESAPVKIRIPKDWLASYDESRCGWSVEGGTYSFIAAKDAESPVMTRKVKVTASFTPTGNHLDVNPLFIEE